jgi:hypothetical protein
LYFEWLGGEARIVAPETPRWATAPSARILLAEIIARRPWRVPPARVDAELTFGETSSFDCCNVNF